MAKRKTYGQLNQSGKDKVAVSTAIGAAVPFGAGTQTYKSSRERGGGRAAGVAKGIGVTAATSVPFVGLGVGAYAGYRRGMHRAQNKNPTTPAKPMTHAPTKPGSRAKSKARGM